MGHRPGPRDLRRLLRLLRAREPQPRRRRAAGGARSWTAPSPGSARRAAASARSTSGSTSTIRTSPTRRPTSTAAGRPTAYAGEVMYADAQVARLLDALDALGLRRNTAIAYLSDHGESLGDHGESTHGIFLYGATLDVPLILAPPPGAALGSPASRAGGPARARRRAPRGRHADAARPRRAARAGRPRRREPPADGGARGGAPRPRPRVAGRAKAAPMSRRTRSPDRWPTPRPTTPASTTAGASSFAVETGRWKFVRAPRPELYDLRRRPEGAPRRLGRAPARRGDPRRAPRGDEPAEDGRGAEAGEDRPGGARAPAGPRLRGRGRVRRRRGAPGRCPIPRTGSRCCRSCCRPRRLRDAGRLDEAARRLEELVRKDPDNPAVHLALSTVYFRRKDAGNAIAAARRAVELNPDSAVAVLDLAFAYQAAGPRRRGGDRLRARARARPREPEGPRQPRRDPPPARRAGEGPRPLPARRRPSPRGSLSCRSTAAASPSS